MPFGVTASIASGLAAAGVGEATAGILAAGLVDAGGGALIGGGISALTGGNVGHGAALGALGGAITGGGGALLGNMAPETAASLGLGADTAANGAGAANTAQTAATVGTNGIAGAPAAPLDSLSSDVSNGIGSPSAALSNNYIPSASGVDSMGVAGGYAPSAATAGVPASVSGSPSTLQNLGQWASKNPLQAAVLGNIGLTGVQAMLPKKQVDVSQNAANTIGTNANFNATLPKYTMQNTATPYTGDWYKYGESPEPVLYNGQPVLQQAQGGLINGYARGGKVRGYAMGGMPQANPLAPAMAAPSDPSGPTGPTSPLDGQNGFAIGQAIGQHLKQTGALNHVKSAPDAYKVGHALGKHLTTQSAQTFAGNGQVTGPGKGQEDAIPAKLSQGEYVIPSEVVSQLGDGSTDAGGDALDQMVHNVRQHKTSHGAKFPPKAHNPLSYIKKGNA